MLNIDQLIKVLTSQQLEHFESDLSTIRLFIPTKAMLIRSSKEYLNVAYGDFILFPPTFSFAAKFQQKNKDKNQQELCGYLFQINPAFFEGKEWATFFKKEALTIIRTTTPTVANFIDIFELLKSEIEYKRLAHEEAIDYFLNFICIHIERTYANYNGFDTYRHTQKERDFFHSINMYINTNYQEQLTHKSIANHFYISENKLKQLFNTYSDKSPHEAIISRRLISCKDLVLEGTPVTKAAKMVGYNDYSTFYRQFILYFGKSPKEFFASLI